MQCGLLWGAHRLRCLGQCLARVVSAVRPRACPGARVVPAVCPRACPWARVCVAFHVFLSPCMASRIFHFFHRLAITVLLSPCCYQCLAVTVLLLLSCSRHGSAWFTRCVEDGVAAFNDAWDSDRSSTHCNTLQHIGLPHTATHCNR